MLKVISEHLILFLAPEFLFDKIMINMNNFTLSIHRIHSIQNYFMYYKAVHKLIFLKSSSAEARILLNVLKIHDIDTRTIMAL